ncbi:hypothetical protein T05_8361 [Trichinella murrelli]|uniref:Uncharacterized protein n=1 Tax=Trichinella murrelli TaxID=144512 RepID=A0A0V0U888_9BILA|nr:hypothetical protein T05_8361 [Trichinella murrelli]
MQQECNEQRKFICHIVSITLQESLIVITSNHFETGWENFPKPLNYVCDETANRKAGIVQAGHL